MITGRPVRIGLLGAGFVSTFYMQALRHVRDHQVIAVHSRTTNQATAFAKEWQIPHTAPAIEELVGRDDVDLVIVGLPHHVHVDAVRAAAGARKAVICTKPLGRNAQEARACLEAVESAGVWHGYAETEVFSPAIVRARALIDSGAVGRVYWVRAREAHAFPHRHARDPVLMGGGPLRGLGCHCVAVGRWLLGYDRRPTEVFCWADRIARDDVQAEDSAVLLVRFTDGSLTQVEVGWGHKAGLDVRVEIHATDGYIRTDETGETGVRAFANRPAGYVAEKATVAQGWIAPVPNEAIAYGYHGALDHLLHCFRRGEPPRQTFLDGYVDNVIIDAGYRSVDSGRWERLPIPDPIGTEVLRRSPGQ